MNTWDELYKGVDAFASLHTLQVVVALATVGAVSMAIVQTIKEFLPLRLWYNRSWLEKWLGDQEVATNPFDVPARFQNALDNIVALTVGRDPEVLYELDADQIAQRLIEIRSVILNYPIDNYHALSVLSVGAQIKDIRAHLRFHGANLPQESCETDEAESPDRQAVRDRIATQLNANISALQVSLTHDWRYRMQVLSMGTTVLLFAVVVGVATAGNILAILLSVPFAVVGSYFAPLTRDLVAALQKLRA